MFGWAGRLKAFFVLPDREYLLLCPQLGEGWGLLHLVRSENAAAAYGWMLQECIQEVTGENFAEWAALQILRRGWQQIPQLYLVPTNEVIGYVVKLPPQLGAGEWQEAAYWELDASLGERGLAAESFAVRSRLIPEKDNCAIVAAVRKDYLQEVQADMAAAELTLADVLISGSWGRQQPTESVWRYAAGQADTENKTAVAEVMQAFVGYADSQEEQLPGLWGRRRERLCWGRLAAAYLALLLAWGGMVLSADIYHYQSAVREQAYYQAELERLAPEAENMNSWQAGRKKLAVREKLLQKLAGEDTAWYPLLVHLGLKTAEGVYITALNSENNCLHITGRALTYDALAEFMAGLESDREFFPDGVTLEEAGKRPGKPAQSSRGIDFKLRIEKGEKADAGTVAAKT